MQNSSKSVVSIHNSCCEHQNESHFSFAGGAVLSFFNVGIARWLIKHVDRQHIQKVYGVSGGALCAAWLLASKNSDSFSYTTEQYLIEWKANVRRLGGRLALRRSLAYHRSLLTRYLPEDAHESCSGRLAISLTNVNTRKAEVISHFRTRQELIDCLIAAMTIPFVNALLPAKVNGKRYIDGGIINNQVVCCENVTLCSPFPYLFSPFEKLNYRPKHSILGMNALRNAFNPNIDVRMQFELGYHTAKKFYENPDAITPPMLPVEKKPKPAKVNNKVLRAIRS